jgi:glycosyltransferase involved in cell wall biosynthesis
LAVSSLAGEDLFRGWRKQEKWVLHHFGIDLSKFDVTVNKKSFRDSLGLPTGAVVVGHVGRFVEQKNHTFLVQIAREIVKRDKRVVFLLVGDGPLRSRIEEQVRRLMG